MANRSQPAEHSGQGQRKDHHIPGARLPVCLSRTLRRPDYEDLTTKRAYFEPWGVAINVVFAIVASILLAAAWEAWLRRAPVKEQSRASLEESGVRFGESFTPWDLVSEIQAFKYDNWSYDEICVQFHLFDGRVVDVSEEHVPMKLIEEVLRTHFSGAEVDCGVRWRFPRLQKTEWYFGEGKTQMDPVQRLHNLDHTLTAIASWRMASADNILLAEAMDAEWRSLDEERQQLRSCATDWDLIRYEVERNAQSNF
jgi:hypothetical protein